MLISTLDIIGFRGFAQEQTLHFAQPNGAVGSGLTIIVGPNNGGKSTIVESLRALSTSFNASDPIRFSEGKRNKAGGDKVLLRVKTSSGDLLDASYRRWRRIRNHNLCAGNDSLAQLLPSSF